MKKTLLSIALILTSSAAYAGSEFPTNPVLRPLTLGDGMFAISGGVVAGEENNKNRNHGFLNFGYGLTDDLTFSLNGLKYRVLARKGNRAGLEVAVGLGVRGYQEFYYDNKTKKGDSTAYGADISGKYVFNADVAVNFGLSYLKWDEEARKNKDEYRVNVGIQKRLAKDWTLGTHYTYRYLKDFTQDDAHEVNVNLNYAYSKTTDFGMFATYSSFDAQENGYQLDNNLDRGLGLYFNTRF